MWSIAQYLVLLGYLVTFIIISSSTFRERIEQIRASLVKPSGWQDSNDDSATKRATEAPTEIVARANRKRPQKTPLRRTRYSRVRTAEFLVPRFQILV
ncbi:uncharacterized protein L3040_000776 [Drepanopeziza brunnea f. sp. 'multigermtubi']|uniref:uncharacterized protein n=1 Tax=Drepanopeziza brunnea f. sp. 'multigermtubi' TaxID=698441 RepID=UPI00239200AA|nr:hypothetical protein L3040_000776 [Drepanopeziza brunnea f. sp. 'multigermtubi']